MFVCILGYPSGGSETCEEVETDDFLALVEERLEHLRDAYPGADLYEDEQGSRSVRIVVRDSAREKAESLECYDIRHSSPVPAEPDTSVVEGSLTSHELQLVKPKDRYKIVRSFGWRDSYRQLLPGQTYWQCHTSHEHVLYVEDISA